MGRALADANWFCPARSGWQAAAFPSTLGTVHLEGFIP
jgi:hypothetical protein